MRLINMLLLCLVSTAHAAWDWQDIVDVPDKYIPDVLTTELTEVECLALNVYHEARGESVLGQQLVAQITINRLNHDSFPSTVCGVVTQYRQFSWTHDGANDHPYDREAYARAYLIAVSFLLLDYEVDIHRAGLVLNYHATSVSPDWPRLHPVFIHGNHIFYARRRDL